MPANSRWDLIRGLKGYHEKENIRLRAADVCLLNLEMFTEIAFEAHGETNTVTSKESDGGNLSATSLTAQVNTQNVVPSLLPGA